MFCSVIETLKLEVFNFVHYRSVPSVVSFPTGLVKLQESKKMSGDDQQFCLRWNDFQVSSESCVWLYSAEQHLPF